MDEMLWLRRILWGVGWKGGQKVGNTLEKQTVSYQESPEGGGLLLDVKTKAGFLMIEMGETSAVLLPDSQNIIVWVETWEYISFKETNI